MIARSPSAVSKPCRPPPNSSPTRAMTAKPCATGWQNAKPRPSSHRARTARSNTIMTRPSTGSATSSSACLPPQGLAPYSHPLRPQHQKLHRRNRPCRRRHLVAVMTPDPSVFQDVKNTTSKSSRNQWGPGWIGCISRGHDFAEIIAREIDRKYTCRTASPLAVCPRLAKEHKDAPVWCPGWSFLKEAFAQKAFTTPVWAHNSNEKFTAKLPCKSDQIAARRPDGSRVPSLPETDTSSISTIRIHYIKLLGSATIRVKHNLPASRIISGRSINRRIICQPPRFSGP